MAEFIPSEARDLSMEKFVIGVDIGGTKIASGIIDVSGKLKRAIVLPTLAGQGLDASLNQVYASIDALLSESKPSTDPPRLVRLRSPQVARDFAGQGVSKKEIKGIGVCAPGPLDPVKGIVHNPPNLPGWREVPLVSLIKKRFNIETMLENDANAAGLAEMVWGAARGYKHIFYITVSTGIGTGIIIDGKIYHGKNGMAGEGGHVTINYDDNDALCGCGNVGCVEAIVSGTHTVRRLKKVLKRIPPGKTCIVDMAGGDLDKVTMRHVEEAAKKKDKVALEAIKDQGKILGIWIGSMISVLDPEIIVIGGGVSMIGEFIFKEIRRSASKHSINIFAAKTPIVRAKLKQNVGIFGAASLFMG